MNLNIKIAKESAISFSGMGMGQVFRYIFTTLLARWVGVELLGMYSIANAVTRIFEVIGKLGLDQGALRAVSREEQNLGKQSVILSALKMGLISGFLCMLVQISLAGWLAENVFHESSLLTKVIVIHALSLPFYIIIHISAHSTQAYKLLKYKIFVTEFQNPLILLLAMVLCYFFYSVESAILIPVVFAAVLGCLTISIFLKNISGVNLLSVRKGVFDKNIVYYSLPIMFIAILGTVLHWTDIFMLGYFTDTSTVGLYHPAARTAGIIRVVLFSFLGIYGPIIAEMYSKNQTEQMNYIFKLVTRWIITFSLPFAILILLYPSKIMLIFGSDFIDGYSILMILVTANLIHAVFGIGGSTLNMAGFPKINLLNTFIGFGLNIGLNIIFIPKMGGNGAAFATLITLGFIAFIRGIQNWKLLNLFPFNWGILKPISAGIVAAGSGYILKIFVISYHTIFILLCAGLVIFAIFFIVLWLLGFDEDDIGLIKGIQIIINNFRIKENSK